MRAWYPDTYPISCTFFAKNVMRGASNEMTFSSIYMPRQPGSWRIMSQEIRTRSRNESISQGKDSDASNGMKAKHHEHEPCTHQRKWNDEIQVPQMIGQHVGQDSSRKRSAFEQGNLHFDEHNLNGLTWI